MLDPDPRQVDDIEPLAPMVLGGYFTMPAGVTDEEATYGIRDIRMSVATGRPLVLREGWTWHSFAGRSSFRWYLLVSFVTGLLLGAAVARL